jgi:alpha-glucosidase
MKSILYNLCKTFFILLAVLSYFPAFSQNNNKSISMGDMMSFTKTQHGIELLSAQGNVKITVYTPTIMRIRYVKNGAKTDDLSYSIIKEPNAASSFTFSESNDFLELKTDSVICEIKKKPIRILFKTLSGDIINQDEPAFGTSWIGEEVTTYKKLVADEKFIGLGEKTGNLNRRGEGYTNWNTDYFGYPTNADPIYMTTPMYIGLHSSTGKQLIYGIFMDNSYKSHFNFGASNDRFSSFTAEDGDMNYYFIYHTSIAGIIESYTELTGRITMPPLWSLGFQQCRYSYYPDKEVLRVAETFREKQIPADVMYLDIHYMDKYKIFTWNQERFPKPKEMLSTLKNNGFHTVVIVDPGIKVEKGYSAYEEGFLQNLFLKYPDNTNFTGQVWPGWCHFPDFTNPATRTWWGNSFKGYIQDGISGFWNDMNEPASWGQRFPDLVEFSLDGLGGTHRRGHNIYGMQMARATFEGTKALMNGERPFILTRAGYSGVQRYSAVWTGDNVSSDDHMMLGVRLLSSMGLTGIPFVGMDIGGFSGNPSKELFARWISIASFSPLCRAHVCVDNKDQEPWSFGEKVEDISRNYLNLRYTLLPYLYTSFYEAHTTGMPIWRSLAIQYPFDNRVYDGRYQHQFTIGQGLMIAAVNSQQEFTKVFLPDNENIWYDFYNDKKLVGDQETLVEAPLDRLPVFVKGGSIIPMQSLIQHTEQKPSDTLFVHVWQTDKGNFSQIYYEDDGKTYAYEQGLFYKRMIKYNADKKSIHFHKVQGGSTSKFSHIKVLIHGMNTPSLQSKVNGKSLPIISEQTSFMKALSNFDPLGGNSSSQTISVQSILCKNDNQDIVITW